MPNNNEEDNSNRKDLHHQTKKTKRWHSPNIFVMSFALLTEVPRLGRLTNDGRGYTDTMYYTMKEET